MHGSSSSPASAERWCSTRGTERPAHRVAPSVRNPIGSSASAEIEHGRIGVALDRGEPFDWFYGRSGQNIADDYVAMARVEFEDSLTSSSRCRTTTRSSWTRFPGSRDWCSPWQPRLPANPQAATRHLRGSRTGRGQLHPEQHRPEPVHRGGLPPEPCHPDRHRRTHRS